MKSNTRLDSVIFQLTPTRTRCDLVITANGKTEKIASGLLKPFLEHLKAAQEQIGKGGYSIVLKPNCGSHVAWFTKGTVERFVRFVSTPEILERVYTIESEISQIETAISLQKRNDTGLDSVEELPVNSEESIEGSKPALGGNEEKAIVLYQPANDQSEEDGSTMPEKNSKVQLVRVFQSRKNVLQKEQGMAFARAAAASFDIDNIAALLSFAECFGASRMMDACKRFVELWKAKHESGQWVEVEATEAMACRSDLPAMNASGIMFLNANEQRELKEPWPQGEVASDKNGISSVVTNADIKPQADQQVQPNPQDYTPGQFPHPMFSPWQMHPQASGMPVFQPYPMRGMPYYQNFQGHNSPFFQPPYPSPDDSRLHSGERTRQRRRDSMDMSADDADEEDSPTRKSRKKGGKSSGKKSRTVVIRNINYISSAKQQGSSDSEPQSCSDSGTDDEEGNAKVDVTRKSKNKGIDDDSLSLKEDRDRDDGHWQAFQNLLLRDADESNSSERSSMFAMEGKVQGKRRQTLGDNASSVLGGRYMGEIQDVGPTGHHHDFDGDVTRIRKPLDTNMDYMINRKENLTDMWDPSLDPQIITNGFHGSSSNKNRDSSRGVGDDESFMILHNRTGSLGQVAGDGRSAMNMDYERPSVHQNADNHAVGTRSETNYEPNDLNLLPNREMEDGPNGHNPALDYEMQAQVEDGAKLNGRKEEASIDVNGPRKGVKNQKLKTEKRITAGTRKEKPSKFSPSEDARARAEKLRAFKADLQKLKKEKEEEQKKRLEALKMERQKRIAARSGVNPAQSTLPSQQARKSLPKLSPVSQKSSKFSDTEPGSSSPLQRSTVRRALSKASSADSTSKVSKSLTLNNGSHESGNRVTRSSSSSLRVRKEENSSLTPDSKPTMARIRRLSEPKGTVSHLSSAKARSAEAVSSRRVSEPASTNLEKTKSAGVPALKLRASKGSSVRTQKKSTKEMLQKPNDKMLSGSPATTDQSKSNGIVCPSDGDDNNVVEKTVVMLECEKPSMPVLCSLEDKTGIANMQSDAYNPGSKPEEDVPIPAPASPIIVKEVDREPSGQEDKVQSYSRLNEREATYTSKALPNMPTISTTEKPYQAPYARVSSVEDPCMANSDYGKAPPTSLAMAATDVETATCTVHVPNDSQRQEDVVKIADAAVGKQQGKEPSKGFRRLLKFGKKNSSESNIQLDKASLDCSVADDNGSSGEVFTLKNLLTQEESSSAGTTPKKSSRSFSLLSTFRIKTSEKKMSS